MKMKKPLLVAIIFSIFMMGGVIPATVMAIASQDAAQNTLGLDSTSDLSTKGTYYYQFINPQPGDTISGLVTIKLQANYDGYTLYRVRVRVYQGYTALTNYYDMYYQGNNVWQINWNTENYDDGGNYRVRFILYRSYYSYASLYLNDLTIDNEGGSTPPSPPPPSGEKIAVFFWATDAGTSTVINKYENILRGEGYTKFFKFRDSTNVQGACQSIDSYEDSNDIIFVYIIGHGQNNGYHSYTAFRAYSQSVVYSNQFRSWMDQWEATRKSLLVESCHSGDWADDFAGSPYLAMSTSDEDHNSFAMGSLPGEGKFSYYFFRHVDDGYNAVDSFYYARNYCSNQYPKIRDYSSYEWFIN